MTSLTAHILRRAGTGFPDAADGVTLDYEGRFLRRKRLVSDAGAAILVDLPETVSLNAGDALEATDGTLIEVRAAPEPLIEIAAPPHELTRLAWHIGNRHTPAQIGDNRILIRRDPVMADMLRRLGADLRETIEPFTPEGGAYGHGRTHGHHHGPADSDPHAHTHDASAY